MKTQNFKNGIDCRLFYGLIIVMFLLLTAIVYDACGIGPTCSPCDSYVFDGVTWRCMGCIADCGSCYKCNTSNQCEEKCDVLSCQVCFSCAEGCKPGCDPAQCLTCDGNGRCKFCNDEQYKDCCNGTCYDIRTQGCCGGTIYNLATEWCCTEFEPHHKCALTETCCYGDCCPANQWCCHADQQCHDECVNSEPSHHCDTTHDDDPGNICPGCTGGILGTHCMDITFRVYTGNENYNCSGGCPGECARHDVHCYTEYKCREEVMRFGVCGVVEGAPGGVACKEASTSLWCIPCHKDTDFPGEDIPVVNRVCGY